MSLFAPFLSPTLEHKLHEVRDFVSFSAESLHPARCLAHSVSALSCVRLFGTPLNYIAHQASLSMGFARQEYWSGLPFLPPGDLPDPGIEPFVACASCRQVYLLSHFPAGSDSKSICLQCGRPGFNPWVGKILWRRKWQPTPVFLPGKFHGWRNLVGYSPWGPKESDTSERFHFPMGRCSIIVEGVLNE